MNGMAKVATTATATTTTVGDPTTTAARHLEDATMTAAEVHHQRKRAHSGGKMPPETEIVAAHLPRMATHYRRDQTAMAYPLVQATCLQLVVLHLPAALHAVVLAVLEVTWTHTFRTTALVMMAVGDAETTATVAAPAAATGTQMHRQEATTATATLAVAGILTGVADTRVREEHAAGVQNARTRHARGFKIGRGICTAGGEILRDEWC